jgi:hypothetical protein
MAAQNKKLWQKPELTILVRNTPAESVLLSCKTNVMEGQHSTYFGCMKTSPCPPDQTEPCCCSCQGMYIS